MVDRLEQEPAFKLSDEAGVSSPQAAACTLPKREARSRVPADRVERPRPVLSDLRVEGELRPRAAPLERARCTCSAPALHAGVGRRGCDPTPATLLFGCERADYSRLLMAICAWTGYSRHPRSSAGWSRPRLPDHHRLPSTYEVQELQNGGVTGCSPADAPCAYAVVAGSRVSR
jgi:hypothetical protein